MACTSTTRFRDDAHRQGARPGRPTPGGVSRPGHPQILPAWWPSAGGGVQDGGPGAQPRGALGHGAMVVGVGGVPVGMAVGPGQALRPVRPTKYGAASLHQVPFGARAVVVTAWPPGGWRSSSKWDTSLLPPGVVTGHNPGERGRAHRLRRPAQGRAGRRPPGPRRADRSAELAADAARLFRFSRYSSAGVSQPDDARRPSIRTESRGTRSLRGRVAHVGRVLLLGARFLGFGSEDGPTTGSANRTRGETTWPSDRCS